MFKIGTKVVEVRLYETVYDRLNGLSDLINVPIDAIINNWLLNGIDTYWGLIVNWLKEIESNSSVKTLKNHEFAFFSELLDSVAEEFLSTDEILRVHDKKIKDEENFREFSSIKEEIDFKILYFKFIERYNIILSDIECEDIPVDLKLIKERFCERLNIHPPQFGLTSIESLEELNDLTDSELLDVIQTSIGDILREKLKLD